MSQTSHTETGIVIRRASTANAQMLAEFGGRTFYETFAKDNKPEDMTAYLSSAFGREKQTAELADPLNTFFVAAIGDVVAAYAQVRAGDETPSCVGGLKPAAELVRLYVDRNYHGRGVGHVLMRRCLETARGEMDARTLWLGVWEHNLRAQAFYRKWEFEIVGAHSFQLGEDVQTDFLMRRSV